MTVASDHLEYLEERLDQLQPATWLTLTQEAIDTLRLLTLGRNVPIFGSRPVAILQGPKEFKRRTWDWKPDSEFFGGKRPGATPSGFGEQPKRDQERYRQQYTAATPGWYVGVDMGQPGGDFSARPNI